MMAVQSKEHVFSLLRENRAQLKSLGVRRLGLFGSFVRQQQKSTSDVDILVEFEADCKTFDNFMRLAILLEELLGRPVELVTPESLSPYIAPHILGEMEDVPLGA